MELRCDITKDRMKCRHCKRGLCKFEGEIPISSNGLNPDACCDKYEVEDIVFTRKLAPCLYCHNSNETSRLIGFEQIDEDDDDDFNTSMSLMFLCKDCGRISRVNYRYNKDEMEKMQ